MKKVHAEAVPMTESVSTHPKNRPQRLALMILYSADAKVSHPSYYVGPEQSDKWRGSRLIPNRLSVPTRLDCGLAVRPQALKRGKRPVAFMHTRTVEVMGQGRWSQPKPSGGAEKSL